MAITSEADLRALNDPWINYFLDEQARLLNEMNVDETCHMAESFGRPGSQTEAGRRYHDHSLEFQVVSKDMTLYALHKGYITLEEMDFSVYSIPPVSDNRA
jgi:hypothetical protein